MKNIFLLLFILCCYQRMVAQYPGPIMDSIKRYQQMIETAETPNEKMQLAMRLQKIITGVSAFDTATINHMPKTKEEALTLRDKQVAAIRNTQKNIDLSGNRKDKYAQIQKLQQKNDSIRNAFKNVSDKGRLQKGLITIPGLEESIWAAQSGMDTTSCSVSFSYTKTSTDKNGNRTSASANGGTSNATLYRQAGNVTVVAMHSNKPLALLNTGIKQTALSGSATYSASGKACRATGNYNGSLGFAFAYNPITNMYSSGMSAGLLTHVECESTTFGQPPIRYDDSSGLSFTAINDPSAWKDPLGQKQARGLIAHFTKTGNGFSVSYSKSEGGTTEIFMATITLPASRYEAFIEPADEEVYKKWLPQGPNLTNYPTVKDGGKGNDIQVKISLWDNKEKKLSDQNYKATVRLDASHLPGYCMNFPEGDDNADNRPDLRFDVADSSQYQVWSDKEIKTAFVSGPQFINVASYDYGGYADITATLTLNDGTVVDAHPHSGNSFLLPMRSNDSYIADAWKKEQHVMDKEDKTDDEKIVTGDKYIGDGLTLFEEYRGFLENRKYFRGDVDKKEVMLCDKIATARSADGINMFIDAFSPYGSKVSVHSKFKDDEFGRKHKPDASEQLAMDTLGVTTALEYDRCINYNNNVKDLHLTDQHGIAIMFADKDLGFAAAITKTANGPISTPKNYHFLIISRNFDPKPEGWSTTYGNVDANGNIKTGEGKAKIITDEYAVTVAHELLHCFHVQHHGNYSNYGKIVFKYFEKEKVWGIVSKDGGKQFLATARAVDLRWEDKPDYEITAADALLVYNRSSWRIYGENSSHSGVEDCIMRYDISHGFTPDNLQTVYLLKSPNYGELTGITLCNSTKGIGVNAEEHLPMSRYGNAQPGRGDCIHQFCVNDKYD